MATAVELVMATDEVDVVRVSITVHSKVSVTHSGTDREAAAVANH